MSDQISSGAASADIQNASNTSTSVESQNGVDSQVEPSLVAPIEDKKAEIKRINKLTLKVHGSEIEESLPFEFDENPEAVEYLTKQLQLSKAAQRAMQENSAFQKQVGQFFDGMKTNTKAKLIELGIDPIEFAKEVIEGEIKKAQMSPEQIRQQQLEDELASLKEASRKKDEEYSNKELERYREIEFQKVENEMSAALDKSDLPKKPYVVRKIAEYMLIASRNKISLTAEDVLPLVRSEIMNDLQEIANSLPEDKVEEFLGKEIFNRARKKNLAKAKITPATTKSAIKDIGTQKAPEKSDPSINYKNFFGF